MAEHLAERWLGAQPPPEIKPLPNIWESIWKSVIDEAYKISEELGKTIEKIYDQSIAPLMNSLFKTFESDLKKFYEHLKKGNLAEATKIAGKYVLATLGIMLLIDLMETKVAGSGLNLTGLKSKIAKVLRFDEWFGAFFGGMMGTGVGKPTSYLANSILTPEIPSPQDLAQLRYEGLISEDQFKENMKYHGYSEDWARKLYTIWDFTPSFFIMERILREMYVPKEVFEEWLNKNRMVNEKHRQVYKDYFDYSPFRDEFMKIESALKSLYEYGFIDETTLRQAIEKIKPHPKTWEATKDYMDLLREKRLTYLMVQKEIYLYRKGVIDENELMNRLVKHGVDSDFAEAYVRLEAAKKGKEWSPTVYS